MTNILIRLLISAVAIMGGAYFIPGVKVNNFGTALVLAVVLALLNFFVRPLLIIFTFPVTLLTLGLFLLVINVIIIYLATYFVKDFRVEGFVSALLFSLVISVISWLLHLFFGGKS
jgi:putative membrane protein